MRMTTSLRRTTTLAATLILASLFLFLLDSRGLLDVPKSAVAALVTPLGRSLTDLGARVSRFGEGDDAELRAQLEAVTAERDQLLAERAQLLELGEQVAQLRDLLDFRQAQPNLTLVQADVVSRDPQSREKFIVINRGSDDGIAVGMPVLSPHFLVGQVTEVEPDRARVLLVIDSGFQTGAVLQMSRAEGIVYGQWQLGGRVVMRHVPVDAEIVDGELVVTSGKTARVPAGLVIGKVLEIDKNTLENETELELLPLIDFDSLSTVTVVTGQGQGTPAP
jgi:rod shape-determining protein MreC